MVRSRSRAALACCLVIVALLLPASARQAPGTHQLHIGGLAMDGEALPAPVSVAASEPSPTPAPTGPVTIAAAGDVMLARGIAWQITPEEPSGPFRYVRDPLTAADITFANMECAISDLGAPEPKSYTFRAPPLAADGTAEAGIDVVSLANNHALDYGHDALAETRALLAAQGVAAVGAGANLPEAAAPAVIVRNGVRVAFVAFMDVPSEAGYDMHAWAATDSTPGVAWATPDNVAAGVAAARTAADVVVVAFHFGAEYATVPSQFQRDISRLAIDSGASLVIGSHPHVLQEVEAYGAGLIAYSLGNFVFDGFEGASNTSAILTVTVDPGGAILSWGLLPAEIGYDGLPRLTG